MFFMFNPICGEMIQFDEHIFQMGWFWFWDKKKKQVTFRHFSVKGHWEKSWDKNDLFQESFVEIDEIDGMNFMNESGGCSETANGV